ncbi:MAG: hypothetical protein ACE5MI_02060 [Acidimicrobiia bacterium]
MPLDQDFIASVRELDEHDLRRLLILAQARLEAAGVLDVGNSPRVSLRQKWVRCGKPPCGGCPHGPYWYAYWQEDGRRRSRYVGRLGDVEIQGAEGARR